MKDTILERARGGMALLISSHLLHLVDEICTHLLILKQGRRVAHGTIDDVRRQFAESAPMPASRMCSFARLEAVEDKAHRAANRSHGESGDRGGGLSMFTALVFLQTRLFWNRVRVQIRRLRQPKYLAGTLAAAAYVYFFLIRGFSRTTDRRERRIRNSPVSDPSGPR